MVAVALVAAGLALSVQLRGFDPTLQVGVLLVLTLPVECLTIPSLPHHLDCRMGRTVVRYPCHNAATEPQPTPMW